VAAASSGVACAMMWLSASIVKVVIVVILLCRGLRGHDMDHSARRERQGNSALIRELPNGWREHPSRLHGIGFDENHIEAYRKPGGLRRLARPAPGHLYKLRPFLAISIRKTVRQIDVALPPVVCRQAAEIPEPHLQ
jgi:hypothetical protein